MIWVPLITATTVKTNRHGTMDGAAPRMLCQLHIGVSHMLIEVISSTMTGNTCSDSDGIYSKASAESGSFCLILDKGRYLGSYQEKLRRSMWYRGRLVQPVDTP